MLLHAVHDYPSVKTTSIARHVSFAQITCYTAVVGLYTCEKPVSIECHSVWSVTHDCTVSLSYARMRHMELGLATRV